MSDWPSLALPANPTITPHSEESLGSGIIITTPSSATWPQLSQARFFPFVIEQGELIQKMFVANGATVSGNVDAGIYDPGFKLIVALGGTAQAGTNTVQELNITDTLLPPGLYYMALVLDNTTGTVFKSTLADEFLLPTMPSFTRNSSYPLPSDASSAVKDAADPHIPVFGLSTLNVV